MQGAAPIGHLTGVPGWETQDEQELLFERARQTPEGAAILELGGEFGLSASIFAKGNPSAHVYSVDIRYDGQLGDVNRSNLQEVGLDKNVVHIAGDSHQQSTIDKFLKLEKQGELDLLFVDGDHSVGGALQDLEMWSPLVKEGGYLLIHDCACTTNRMPHPIHFDVTRALALFLEKYGTQWIAKETVNTTTVFQRVASASDKTPAPDWAITQEEKAPVAKPKGRSKK